MTISIQRCGKTTTFCNVLRRFFLQRRALRPRFGREPSHDDDFYPAIWNEPREAHVLRSRETRRDSALSSQRGTALGRATMTVFAKLVQTHVAACARERVDSVEHRRRYVCPPLSRFPIAHTVRHAEVDWSFEFARLESSHDAVLGQSVRAQVGRLNRPRGRCQL